MKKQKTKQRMDPLIRNIIILMIVLIIADLAVILYFQKQASRAAKVSEQQGVTEIAAEEYINPEAGKLRTLKTSGEFEKKMPVFQDKLKFNLTFDPILAGPNNLHVLQVCCPAGYSKEFYTAKMLWAFLLYEFEPGVPTATLFDIDNKAKTGRFVIVILDKTSDEAAIKAVSVTIFIELLKQYMPSYSWEGSVRKELM